MPTPGLHCALAKHQRNFSHLPKQCQHVPCWLKNQIVNPPGGGRCAPGRSKHKRLTRRVEKHLPGTVSPSSYLCPLRKCRGSSHGQREDGERPAALVGVWKTTEGQTSLMCWVKRVFLLLRSQPVRTMGKALGAAGAAPSMGTSWGGVGAGLCPRAGAGRWVRLSKQPGAAAEPPCRDSLAGAPGTSQPIPLTAVG